MKREELITFLNLIVGKRVEIKNSGYISSKNSIKSLSYEINYEILVIKDSISNNYMMFDLNAIKQININENNAILNLFYDDEIAPDIVINVL